MDPRRIHFGLGGPNNAEDVDAAENNKGPGLHTKNGNRCPMRVRWHGLLAWLVLTCSAEHLCKQYFGIYM